MGMAFGGLLVYVIILPSFGQSMASQFPEFSHWYRPWMIFLWVTVVPCYIVLYYCWNVASNIGKGKAFSFENGEMFRKISVFAAGDCIFFLAGNIVLLLLNVNHPGIVILSLIIIFFGMSISIASKVMAQLVDNAAFMQEEAELTI